MPFLRALWNEKVFCTDRISEAGKDKWGLGWGVEMVYLASGGNNLLPTSLPSSSVCESWVRSTKKGRNGAGLVSPECARTPPSCIKAVQAPTAVFWVSSSYRKCYWVSQILYLKSYTSHLLKFVQQHSHGSVLEEGNEDSEIK